MVDDDDAGEPPMEDVLASIAEKLGKETSETRVLNRDQVDALLATADDAPSGENRELAQAAIKRWVVQELFYTLWKPGGDNGRLTDDAVEALYDLIRDNILFDGGEPSLEQAKAAIKRRHEPADQSHNPVVIAMVTGKRIAVEEIIYDLWDRSNIKSRLTDDAVEAIYDLFHRDNLFDEAAQATETASDETDTSPERSE